MRRTSIRGSAGPPGPAPAYSVRTTLLGTVAFLAAVGGGLLAASYPMTAVAVVAVALAARPIVRAVRERVRERRRAGRSRRVCVPAVGICIEA